MIAPIGAIHKAFGFTVFLEGTRSLPKLRTTLVKNEILKPNEKSVNAKVKADDRSLSYNVLFVIGFGL